ncbi:MAG: crotonobetainyl-CoA:carnitine CoA-transferase CaiB-like acyl-CoA transferase [Gammaproteobacteria bacterium]|jgi:crotonobetainyl-CoA:carnitine CoA-transferase CaiB-like acyl-CoA transferase
MSDNENGLPLARFKVLDLTRARAGPTCARQLADWGADVIKVEAPPGMAVEYGDTRHGADFQNLHRNKRSLTLDLKKPEGVAVLKRMVESADVLIENYRPGVKHRLGIGYETLSAINPRLVYGSLSGFGQTGPYAERPGFDQIAQGMGGLMSITGLPGQGPVRVGIPVADLTSGIYLSIGIAAALIERDRSGKGQWVHTSLLQSMISMLDFQAARWTIASEVAPQAGNNHPTGIPTGVFATADGHINIAAAGDHIYKRFSDALEAPELLTDERFSTAAARQVNRDALNAVIDTYTVRRSSDEWVDLMNDAGVPCGPIYSIDQTFADPQVQHLKMATSVHHEALGDIDLIAQPVNLSRTPSAIRRPTPDCGEHTDEVLGELGLSPDEINTLRDEAVI